jgi:hypothetical protein
MSYERWACPALSHGSRRAHGPKPGAQSFREGDAFLTNEVGAMQFYFLTGFTVVAVAFLVMIAVQLFRIEKAIAEVTEATEFHVKKIYEKA